MQWTNDEQVERLKAKYASEKDVLKRNKKIRAAYAKQTNLTPAFAGWSTFAVLVVLAIANGGSIFGFVLAGGMAFVAAMLWKVLFFSVDVRDT